MMAGPPGLTLDWIAIWQSELSASATDRERAEAWSILVAHGADLARLWSAWTDGSLGSAALPPSARAAPPDAAFDARDAALEHLARRVAELERRLDGHSSGAS